jgi:predicted hotdog family 3-hydroxylacyl-ACP dehydratase
MTMPPIHALLPHAAPMLLLDEVLGWDDTSITALATVTDRNPFVTARGLPAHVGIELMAQTCGAWAGAKALAAGEAVRVGFLLGTRRYTASVDWFPLGESLEIVAQLVFQDRSMGVFDCRVTRAGEILAQAQLSVFQPEQGDS